MFEIKTDYYNRNIYNIYYVCMYVYVIIKNSAQHLPKYFNDTKINSKNRCHFSVQYLSGCLVVIYKKFCSEFVLSRLESPHRAQPGEPGKLVGNCQTADNRMATTLAGVRTVQLRYTVESDAMP